MAVDRVAVLSAAVGVVAVCAALAAFGFQGRITAVGVDLGTTYSVIGVRSKAGTHIIADAEGRVLLPSVVSFMPGGAVKTGYEAQEALPSNPRNTIYNAKRFIGSQWSEKLSAFVEQNYAFRILPNNTGLSGVAFRLDAPGHPPTVAPEEVGAHVLRKLLDNAYRYLGHKQVRTAVIAVPAKFDETQRVATARAFELAGLKVTRVMEEPVAAAVAYGLHTQENVTHILVYDFGGGTLDVSLLYVREGSVQVYANEGDDQLGGSDFDHCLASKVLARVEERAGVGALPSTTTTTEEKGSKDVCTAPRIRQLSEAAKRELSFKDTACISCRLPRGGSSGGSSTDGEEVASVCVKREEFEDWCSEVFARALAPVHRLLAGLGMNASDIDEVVLVGGTTRTPKVKALLRAEFGADKINDHIDPDVTVAVGAATIVD